MSSEFTKIFLFTITLLYLSSLFIDLHHPTYHKHSFLQSAPKKINLPRGAFSYIFPSDTNPTSSGQTVQRSQSSITVGNKRNSARVDQRRPNSAGGITRSSGDINNGNIPFPIPIPDYLEDSDQTPSNANTQDMRTSSRTSPSGLKIPEVDYLSSDEEVQGTKRKPKSSILRRLSKSKIFGISNLLANQAVAKARNSFSSADLQPTNEERRARRKSDSLMRESFSYVNQNLVSGYTLSKEVPQNIVTRCQNALQTATELANKINSEIKNLYSIQELIRACNCGTNNCFECQEHLSLYDLHKSNYNGFSMSLKMALKFLTENCFSGRLNKYESNQYYLYFKQLFEQINEQIMSKNRLFVRNLLLKCEIIKITDEIFATQEKCRKCKKKNEPCSKHIASIQKLKEIESKKHSNSLEISSILQLVNSKIPYLPIRMINKLQKLEHQDEKFLTSQIIVKECMKKLEISTINISNLSKVSVKGIKTKKSSRRRHSSGTFATKPSAFRPEYIGTSKASTKTKSKAVTRKKSSESSNTHAGPNRIQYKKPSGRSHLGTYSRTSSQRTTRSTSIYSRPPSGTNRRTPGSPGVLSNTEQLTNALGQMAISRPGPFPGPESGAIPKRRK